MCTKIKVEKVNGVVNKWSCKCNGKDFVWEFSKEMPMNNCIIGMKDLSSILNSQLKITEKLVAMFMLTNRFVNTSACLYTNIVAAEKLKITSKTMGKALRVLVDVGILNRVKKGRGSFAGYQYYIQKPCDWNLPVKKDDFYVVEIGE